MFFKSKILLILISYSISNIFLQKENKNTKSIRKLLNSDSNLFYHKFNIYYDLEILNTQINKTIGEKYITQEYYLKLMSMLNKLSNLWENLLYVKSNKTIYINSKSVYSNSSSNNTVYRENIPNVLNKLIETDIVLVPNIVTHLSETTLASAYHIVQDKNTGRPILGVINLRNDYNFTIKNAENYYLMVLCHELTHVLVFKTTLFNSFPKYNGEDSIIKRVNNRSFITSPKVLETARKHFNCYDEDFIGVELELQGGGANPENHWESSMMLGDYMVASAYMENYISDITLALFEDSGWYKANYYTGGLFRFGKLSGCGFLNLNSNLESNFNCDEYGRDFCSVEKLGVKKCSSGNLDRGFCYGMSYVDNNCDIIRNLNDLSKGYYYYHTKCNENGLIAFDDDFLSENSICVLNTFNNKNKYRTSCFYVECDYDSNKVKIYYNNINIYNCSEYEEISIENYGKIICPDFNRVCTGTIYCTEPFECVEKKSENLLFFNKTKNYVIINIIIENEFIFIGEENDQKFIIQFNKKVISNVLKIYLISNNLDEINQIFLDCNLNDEFSYLCKINLFEYKNGDKIDIYTIYYKFNESDDYINSDSNIIFYSKILSFSPKYFQINDQKTTIKVTTLNSLTKTYRLYFYKNDNESEHFMYNLNSTENNFIKFTISNNRNNLIGKYEIYISYEIKNKLYKLFGISNYLNSNIFLILFKFYINFTKNEKFIHFCNNCELNFELENSEISLEQIEKFYYIINNNENITINNDNLIIDKNNNFLILKNFIYDEIISQQINLSFYLFQGNASNQEIYSINYNYYLYSIFDMEFNINLPLITNNNENNFINLVLINENYNDLSNIEEFIFLNEKNKEISIKNFIIDDNNNIKINLFFNNSEYNKLTLIKIIEKNNYIKTFNNDSLIIFYPIFNNENINIKEEEKINFLEFYINFIDENIVNLYYNKIHCFINSELENNLCYNFSIYNTKFSQFFYNLTNINNNHTLSILIKNNINNNITFQTNINFIPKQIELNCEKENKIKVYNNNKYECDYCKNVDINNPYFNINTKTCVSDCKNFNLYLFNDICYNNCKEFNLFSYNFSCIKSCPNEYGIIDYNFNCINCSTLNENNNFYYSVNSICEKYCPFKSILINNSCYLLEEIYFYNKDFYDYNYLCYNNFSNCFIYDVNINEEYVNNLLNIFNYKYEFNNNVEISEKIKILNEILFYNKSLIKNINVNLINNYISNIIEIVNNKEKILIKNFIDIINLFGFYFTIEKNTNLLRNLNEINNNFDYFNIIINLISKINIDYNTIQTNNSVLINDIFKLNNIFFILNEENNIDNYYILSKKNNISYVNISSLNINNNNYNNKYLIIINSKILNKIYINYEKDLNNNVNIIIPFYDNNLFNYSLYKYYKDKRINIFNENDKIFKYCFISENFKYDLTQKIRFNLFQNINFNNCEINKFLDNESLILNCNNLNNNTIDYNFHKTFLNKKIYNLLPFKCFKNLNKIYKNFLFWIYLILLSLLSLIIFYNIKNYYNLNIKLFIQNLEKLIEKNDENENKNENKNNNNQIKVSKFVKINQESNNFNLSKDLSSKSHMQISSIQLKKNNTINEQELEKNKKSNNNEIYNNINFYNLYLNNLFLIHPIFNIFKFNFNQKIFYPKNFIQIIFIFDIFCFLGFNSLLINENKINKLYNNKQIKNFVFPLKKNILNIFFIFLMTYFLNIIFKFLCIKKFNENINLANELKLLKKYKKKKRKIEKFFQLNKIKEFICYCIIYVIIFFMFFYSLIFTEIYVNTLNFYFFSIIWIIIFIYLFFIPLFILIICLIENKIINDYNNGKIYYIKFIFNF